MTSKLADPTDFTAGWAMSGGDRVRFEAGGSGPSSILLIPGLGFSVRGLDPIVSSLRDEHRVIAMEPRGSGDCPLGARPFDGHHVARDVVAVLDECAETQTHVLGISMGGMIAQQAAVLAPERIRTLSLVATHSAACEWTKRIFALRLRILEHLGSAAQAELTSLVLASPGTFDRNPEMVEDFRKYYASGPPDPISLAAQMRFCIDHDVRDELAEIDCPALVVAAAEDLLIPATTSQELASGFPDGRYVEIAEASHLLLVEARSRLLDEVQRFIRSVDSQSPSPSAAEGPH